jgi:hypothetical protein
MMLRELSFNQFARVINATGLVPFVLLPHEQEYKKQYHYRHIFVYLWEDMKKREENTLQP